VDRVFGVPVRIPAHTTQPHYRSVNLLIVNSRIYDPVSSNCNYSPSLFSFRDVSFVSD